MAYKGKIISNQVNGQSLEFITTAKDSDGKLLEMISTWQPRSAKPAEHFHPVQRESFYVLQGEISLLLNGKKMLLKKGEVIDIPAGHIHSMWNESEQETVVRWKVFPAMKTEYLLETGMGLAASGRIRRNGLPGILQASLLAQRHRREFRLSKPAYIVQRIVFALLTPFALLAGKKAVYKKYLD